MSTDLSISSVISRQYALYAYSMAYFSFSFVYYYILDSISIKTKQIFNTKIDYVLVLHWRAHRTRKEQCNRYDEKRNNQYVDSIYKVFLHYLLLIYY
jgi:hypothetical protein